MCESVKEWHDELLAEGVAKGETKFAALVSIMIKSGDAGNIQKAADDICWFDRCFDACKFFLLNALPGEQWLSKREEFVHCVQKEGLS